MLVDTPLCSSCSSKVTPHNNQCDEKRFTAGFLRVNCDCWFTVFARNLQIVRHELSYRDGTVSDSFVARPVKHVLLFVVIFCACDRRDIDDNITNSFFFNCIYEINFAFKIFQLSYIVRSLKMFGLFTDNYWILTKIYKWQ